MQTQVSNPTSRHFTWQELKPAAALYYILKKQCHGDEKKAERLFFSYMVAAFGKGKTEV